jgi:hypothetical protein
MPGKGEQYTKIFRRAGLAWGKGDVHKALAIVEEGLALATARGDQDVAHMLRQDLSRYQRLARGEDVRLDQ